MKTDQSLIGVEEAAGMLGIKPNTLRTWVRSGHIQAIKIGRGRRKTLRFEPKTIHRYIERRKG